MSICGGGGAYWLSGELTEDMFFEAIDPNANADEGALVVCGGQESSPKANRLVGLEEALEAAKAVFWSGRLTRGLTWEVRTTP